MTAAKATPSKEAVPSSKEQPPYIDTTAYDLTDKFDRKHLDVMLQLGEYDEPRYIR